MQHTQGHGDFLLWKFPDGGRAGHTRLEGETRWFGVKRSKSNPMDAVPTHCPSLPIHVPANPPIRCTSTPFDAPIHTRIWAGIG
jgi:hypothetical protein